MRIAVTGTHGSGKTTLVEDFLELRPGYEHEPEPYLALAQNGVTFSDGASLPDLEEQLSQSIAMLLAHIDDRDVIFDRCPLDYVGYLEVVAEREGTEWEPSGKLLGRIEKALASLDLIVFVPLLQPDEIAVAIEQPRLRKAVDQRLKRIIGDDVFDLRGTQTRVVEITGSRAQRVERLMATLA
jgi:GTPase SAR1 family protein